jgi:hypothetical protein
MFDESDVTAYERYHDAGSLVAGRGYKKTVIKGRSKPNFCGLAKSDRPPHSDSGHRLMLCGAERFRAYRS